MKKFKFSLQSVLRLKINIEDNEKTQLYILKSQLNTLLEEKRVLDELYAAGVEEQREICRRGTSPARLIEMSHYLQDMEMQQKQKQDEIDAMQLRADEQLEAVMQASTEVKTLEKLKEKQWTVYTEKANKEQDIIIEDFVAGQMALNS